MSRQQSSFIYRWVIGGFALLIATAIVQGIRYQGTTVQFIILAALFGLVNAFLRPILLTLSCPLVLLTLGLFIFVVNAILLLITASLGQAIGIPFQVDSFGTALLGSIIISIVSTLASMFVHE